MKKVGILSVVLIAIFATGCAKKSSSVKAVKGTKVYSEKADKSIIDAGVASLLPAQKFATVGAYFGDYDVVENNRVILSKFNIEKSNVLSSDIWFYGGGKTRLTNSSYFNSNPSLSKDNKNVYFVSDRGKRSMSSYDQYSYIWKMTSKGNGGITRIGTGMNKISNPIESPNGKNLLFSAREFGGQNSVVWYMSKNGALPTQLKEGVQAKWLDDDTILFSAKDPSTGLFAIWMMNIDGSDLTQIISDKNLHCLQPSASKDGKYIAFVKQKKKYKNERDIYIFNTETGLTDQMTTNSSRDDLPKWSQDNEYIYFRSSRGLAWNIWRVKTNFQ